jgi:hypothetical protein
MTTQLEDHAFDSYTSPFGVRSEHHRLHVNRKSTKLLYEINSRKRPNCSYEDGTLEEATNNQDNYSTTRDVSSWNSTNKYELR